MTPLPDPSPEARAHSERVAAHIRDEIARAGGWLGFARFMELALYAPGLGYYMAGARKLGAEGDFTTAPELAPLYGHTLARAAAEALAAPDDEILEIGAGTGALAASLLEELERLGRLPRRYLIVELSPELRARSRDTLAARVPHLMERVAWLNGLPPAVSGFVIGNEVLDAMPVHVVRARGSAIEEAGVSLGAGGAFEWAYRPAAGEVARAARALALPDGYTDRDRARRERVRREPRAHDRARRRALRRLRLPAARVLPPAAQPRHADVPLPPPRARRPVLPARPAGHHRARRFHRGRRSRARAPARTCSATPRRRSCS